MSRRGELLGILADGREHSGEELAAQLGITRAAVWKQLQGLEAWGLELVAQPRRGYRLAAPLDLLDRRAIRRALPELAAARLRRLEVHEELASTSDALLAVADLPPGRCDVCLAEFQSAGRGRRGRQWLAPYGAGLCLSLNWHWRDAPAGLAALSLAIGVAALTALRAQGISGLALKWPNDILRDGAKLGGILIDLRAEAGGPTHAVIGLGLNVALPAATRTTIAAQGLAAADLADLPAGQRRRNTLAAALTGGLVVALVEFTEQGFAPFDARWREADALRDRPVRIERAGGFASGVARGIDADGALLVDIDGRRERFVSGEVSLRPAA